MTQSSHHILCSIHLPIIIMCAFLTLSSCNSPKNNNAFSKDYYIDWANKIAQSEMAHNPELWMTDFVEEPKWDYTQGLIANAMLQMFETTTDSDYLAYVQKFADYFIEDDGHIRTYDLDFFNLDKINGGIFLFNLMVYNPQEKYNTAIEFLRQQLLTHPRTREGGFWHKDIYPHQMWLDGLYMAEPFYARYAIKNNQQELFDDIINQFIIIDKHTKKENGLNYHGWDESKQQAWSNQETGCSANTWGRAEGWYAMALVDVLDFIPQEHPKRQIIIDIFQRICKSALIYRSNNSLWYQVLDMPNEEGNYQESTCSAMFCYAMAKGARMNYLEENYLIVAQETFEGIISNKIKQDTDGFYSLIDCCAVAGLGGDPYRSGTYEYYIHETIRDNDPKGLGPLIMAALELSKSTK